MTATRVIRVTEREAQVAYALIYDGAPNDIIARRLGISVETVKHHVKRLSAKVETNNRTALAVAILRGDVVLRGPIPADTARRFQDTPFNQTRSRLCPAPRSSVDGPAVESGS